MADKPRSFLGKLKAEHTVIPADQPLAGSGGPDLPGIFVQGHDDRTGLDSQTSHNWVGSGYDSQTNYYQTITKTGSMLSFNHDTKQMGPSAVRDTFAIDNLHYHVNQSKLAPEKYPPASPAVFLTGNYATIQQVAEGTYGLLFRSTTEIYPDNNKIPGTDTPIMHAQMTSFETRVYGKPLLLDEQRIRAIENNDINALPLDMRSKFAEIREALVRTEASALTAYQVTINNLTDGKGGPPPGGINPNYQAAMVLPPQFGAYAAAQVGAATYRVTPGSVDQIGGPGDERVHIYGQFTGLGRAGALLGLKTPMAADVQRAWVNNINGNEHYDPRLNQMGTNAPGLYYESAIGEQRSVPESMKPAMDSGMKALALARPLVAPGIDKELELGFVNHPGKNTCPNTSIMLVTAQQNAPAATAPAAHVAFKP